jgi:hypothetical protein
MFSFNKSSCESRLNDILQDKFFKTARRNKILAKWAGGRLGYSGLTLEKYIRNTIFYYLLIPSDRKIISRILSDFKKAGIHTTEGIIRQKIRAIEERIKNKAHLKDVN